MQYSLGKITHLKVNRQYQNIYGMQYFMCKPYPWATLYSCRCHCLPILFCFVLPHIFFIIIVLSFLSRALSDRKAFPLRHSEYSGCESTTSMRTSAGALQQTTSAGTGLPLSHCVHFPISACRQQKQTSCTFYQEPLPARASGRLN